MSKALALTVKDVRMTVIGVANGARVRQVPQRRKQNTSTIILEIIIL